VATGEWCLYGACDWADPPEARAEELTDGLAISCDRASLQLGPGWWYDSYFGWYSVYEPGPVARSLAGDHAWVPGFLAQWGGPDAEPGAGAIRKS
jgi:hypothetical protein